MDCRYCHNGVEDSWFSNLPGASTCMNCHSQVLKDDPRLPIVRDSATNNTPIAWVQIHTVPDYAYFNHEVHVRRGISCVECHGRVDQMDEVHHAKPLSMSFCLDCHRNPAAFIRPPDKVTDLGWQWSTNAAKNAEMQEVEGTETCARHASGIAAKLLGLSPMNNDLTIYLASANRRGLHPGAHREPTHSATPVAVTGAAWTNWRTRRSSRTGCTANFPRARANWKTASHRRHFLKIMSASFALAGLGFVGAGCRRPEEKLEPFGQQPEDYVYGEPQFSPPPCRRAPERFRWSSNPTKAGQ